MRDVLPKDKWIRHRMTHVAIMIPTEHGKIFTDQTKRTIKNADEECWGGNASRRLPDTLVSHTYHWKEINSHIGNGRDIERRKRKIETYLQHVNSIVNFST